ncbi:MAG TPA: MmcQ/YjbR family DNA-binding protein [Candidatus Tumulicola sp.]|jgi:hypothetical protein
MASWADVRRIALALPGATEKVSFDNAAWTVNGKLFVWERPLRRSDLAALGAAAPKGAILGVRTADLDMKEILLARNPRVYFTTPHFDGYPAVLVRLGTITIKELRDLILEAWLARAPKRAIAAYLRENAGSTSR